jgi:competence protein ComEA
MGEKEFVPPGYHMPLALIGVSIIALVSAVFLLIKTTQRNDPIQFSSDNIKDIGASQSATLTVDVSGAVRKPGVYTLPVNSRVIDAITSAGGMTEEADTDVVAATVNQASVLSDGAKVYIPIRGTTGVQGGAPSLVSAKTISINTGSLAQLDTLSGVGPVTAQKVIDNRPYTKLEDLVTKKVMGQSLFDKLKNQLTL